MLALILMLICTCYFSYLMRWARSVLSKEYNFGSTVERHVLPHSPTLSVAMRVFWCVLLLAGAFWGFTFNRYPAYLSIRNADTEIVLLGALCASIGLSYLVIYRLGEIKGVVNMKSTELFRTSANNATRSARVTETGDRAPTLDMPSGTE